MKQRHYFTDKCPSSQIYGFSSGHVCVWELDHKESWVPKNWCFWTVVLENTLESPLHCKDIQPVHPKGNQSWIFIARTDAEAEVPILWPSDAKKWLIGKDCDAGKDWRQEEEVRQRRRWLVGIPNSMDMSLSNSCCSWVWATLGVGDGQGSLMCFSPRGHKELDTPWLPTPVLLPGKSHGWRSLVGYSPWSRKELDTTEQLSTAHTWSSGIFQGGSIFVYK